MARGARAPDRVVAATSHRLIPRHRYQDVWKWTHRHQGKDGLSAPPGLFGAETGALPSTRAAGSSHWPNGWRLCWQLLLLHRSAAGSHFHVCMCMTSSLHNTMRGKPTSPLSTLLPLPSASAPSAGPRWSPPYCGCLGPALCALSRLSACSSCRPSLFPLRPAPSVARCTTLYHALSPFRWTTPRTRNAACPQPPLALHLNEPAPGAPPIFVGSGQSHCAQVTGNAALRLAPLSLSSLACPVLTRGPLCLLSPSMRTLHNNVQGTLSSPCPGPSCRCAHGAWQSSAFWPLLCPCLVPSAAPPSLARPVPSFALVHCPFCSAPTPCAPPPSEHDAQHSPVLVHTHPVTPLLASCFTWSGHTSA